jgi:predicted negative regulator of RcsB-dependent stress response
LTDVESDEELVELIQRYWARYGVSLIIGVVLAVGGVLGWRSYEARELETAEAASTAYYRYEQAKLEGREADAELEAARLAEAHGDTAYALFLALAQAKDAVEAGDLSSAKAALEKGLSLAPTDALKDVVRLRLARVAMAEEGAEAALRQLEGIRQGQTMAGVAELRGDALASLGAFDEARAAYAAALTAAEGALPMVTMKLDALPVKAEAPASDDDPS